MQKLRQLITRQTPGGLGETARIVWPLALAMMAGALNHVCDRLFLAHCDDAALEAVLPAEMLSALLSGFLVATLGYSGTFVAQLHGGGKPHAAVRAFAQGLWLTAFALPLFGLFIPLGNLIIDSCGNDAAVKAAEKAYFAINAPAGILCVLNCVLAGILTGQGHTRYTGFCTVVGALTNLALDPLFIFGCRLGIAGAATATALAQGLTTILLVLAVVRDPLVRSGWAAGDFRFRLERCLAILRFGLPLGANSLIGGISFTAFNFLVARCAPHELAASNTVFAVNNVFYLATCAAGQGVTILAGRHHGARNDEAAVNVYRSGLILVAIALAVCFAVALPGAGFIMDLFRGADSTFDPAVFRRCGFFLFLIMFFREIAEGLTLVAGGALRGVGDTKYVMLFQCGIELFVRLPLIFLVASLTNSVYWLWLTMPIDLGLTAFFLNRRWLSNGWRTIRLEA